ncbi:MAG: HAD family hydrolase [Treponema sp.]|nr:HAD family hydrolase [Treponema sp.]MBP5752669.1 HAD family hydrolase [Treponema sp.]
MNNTSKYDGIILDIDGTIWNTTGIVAMAWNRAINISGMDARKVNAQDLQKEFGKTMDVIAEDLWPNLNKEQRDILMANCCTEETISLNENTLDITYPGVVDTIKKLSLETNFFVVSNCQDGYIQLMMEKTGLEECIKDWECFGRTGKGKAENIMMLVQRNQLTSPAYVGDIQGDCDACRQAGVPFIWASYGFGEVKSYIAKLNSFSDLEEVIEVPPEFSDGV